MLSKSVPFHCEATSLEGVWLPGRQPRGKKPSVGFQYGLLDVLIRKVHNPL